MGFLIKIFFDSSETVVLIEKNWAVRFFKPDNVKILITFCQQAKF